MPPFVASVAPGACPKHTNTVQRGSSTTCCPDKPDQERPSFAERLLSSSSEATPVLPNLKALPGPVLSLTFLLIIFLPLPVREHHLQEVTLSFPCYFSIALLTKPLPRPGSSKMRSRKGPMPIKLSCQHLPSPVQFTRGCEGQGWPFQRVGQRYSSTGARGFTGDKQHPELLPQQFHTKQGNYHVCPSPLNHPKPAIRQWRDVI